MQIKIYKYCFPFLLYIGALIAFYSYGLYVWLPLVYAWVLVPLAELFLPPDEKNISQAEEELMKNDRWYDLLLYLVVPFQFSALFIFLYQVSFVEHHWLELAGKTLVMGLLCSTFGINVAHELGHRNTRFEKTLSKLLLMSSLYMHFFIEHNKGHHKRVATPEDPSSARYGEPLYFFVFRSTFLGYFSAWKISINEMKKKGHAVFSIHNEMIHFHIIQILFVTAIFFYFGWLATLLFLIAALDGIFSLETVNYIEHYGLQRQKISEGKYERAAPHHSWNSNHVIGRVMLFELSRHSDHHYMANRKYQVLRHHDHSPQMPTGYPGMMILAMLPPAWFYVMNKRVKELKKKQL